MPYKHSIFFQKPLNYSKIDIQTQNSNSKKLYNIISTTEKKSALDYTYWEAKILHQIINESVRNEFERSFINLTILSKNNLERIKSLKLYYLRNIPRFSKEVGLLFVNN